MKPFKYVLCLVDPNQPKNCEMSIYIDECSDDIKAIAESEAQFNLMTSLGGIPYDERWNKVEGSLLRDDKKIWSDIVIMEY